MRLIDDGSGVPKFELDRPASRRMVLTTIALEITVGFSIGMFVLAVALRWIGPQ